MTPLEWALLAAILGVGGYAGYKHYYPTVPAGSAGTTTTTPNDTRGTVFGDPACQAQYNALPPDGKKQIDVAVQLSKSSGPAALVDASGILRKAGYAAIADCLQNLAKTTPAPGAGGGAAGCVTPGCKLFTGPCLDLYKGLPATDQAGVDAAITAAYAADAKQKGTGPVLLAQFASTYTNADPAKASAIKACLVTAAVQMNDGKPLPVSTGGTPSPVAAGSGRAIFPDAACQASYDHAPDAARAYIDTQVAAAQAVGGENGAKILASAATAFLTGGPYGDAAIYACLWTAATTMNGGKPVDMPELPGSNPASVLSALNPFVPQLFNVGTTGLPLNMRAPLGFRRGAAFGYGR